MTLSTIGPLLLTTPFAASLLELTVELLPLIAKVGRHIVAFRRDTVMPAACHAFERDLQKLLRDIGRVIVCWVYNHLETADLKQAPDLIHYDHNVYRRRPVSPRRGGIATLFGIISLRRIRYEPCDAGIGLTCILSSGATFGHRRGQGHGCPGQPRRHVDGPIHPGSAGDQPMTAFSSSHTLCLDLDRSAPDETAWGSVAAPRSPCSPPLGPGGQTRGSDRQRYHPRLRHPCPSGPG